MSFKAKVSPKLVSLVFSVLIICFALAFYIFAWTPPTEAPPLGNVASPLNTSANGQTKLGGLTLNTSAIPATDALIIAQSYLQIDAIDGAPAAGDCTNNSLAGRIILDYTNNLFYVCSGATGWRSIAL